MEQDCPIMLIFCWRQHFLGTILWNDVMWRHVTSSCLICTKSIQIVLCLSIVPWSKYEVNSIIQTEIMTIWIFPTLIWKGIGNWHPQPTIPLYLVNYWPTCSENLLHSQSRVARSHRCDVRKQHFCQFGTCDLVFITAVTFSITIKFLYVGYSIQFTRL